jgi:histidinol-phosphate aminotransferase
MKDFLLGPRGELAPRQRRGSTMRAMSGGAFAAIDERSFARALDGLVPYEPGKPAEELRRELGLDRIVKLASNEGPFGPFPAALDAITRASKGLNRYPDGGLYQLRGALAERHGVQPENIAPAAGADAVILYLSLAMLDPGDEVVLGWPSFPSYVLDAMKVGAVPVWVPLREHRYDPETLLEAVTARTKIVYLCNPNNPTGTMVGREAIDAYFDAVPDHVLTVLDEAYFEYVDDPDYPDGIEEYLKAGRRVVVLRTFSKIYGLAGLRLGYGVAPPSVVSAIRKVQKAFDVSRLAQEAALASLDDSAELQRRQRANATARELLLAGLSEHGLRPASPPVANFVFMELDGNVRALFGALLEEGVIIRPVASFGAPNAIRITVGTEEENQMLLDALPRALVRAGLNQ